MILLSRGLRVVVDTKLPAASSPATTTSSVRSAVPALFTWMCTMEMLCKAEIACALLVGPQALRLYDMDSTNAYPR